MKQKQEKLNKAENFVKRFAEAKKSEGLERGMLAAACTKEIKDKFNNQGGHLPREYKKAIDRFIFA